MKRKTAFLLSMLMIVMSVLSNVNFSSTQISTEAASYDIDDYLDIKGGSDYITVSWCKFYYTDSSSYIKHIEDNSVSTGSSQCHKNIK